MEATKSMHTEQGRTELLEKKWQALPILIAVLFALGIVILRAVGTSAWDLGDGALHYLQARHAPSNIHYFFDRWAKPVYVLLGTAFAQFGPIGMVVFNAIIACVTSWAIIALIRPAPRVITLLVPVLLFTSTQYFRVAISGLTEPLFGLLTIACLWLLWRERYVLAIVLLSISPWTRPEYLVFAPLVIIWVLYERKWVTLPWLLVGPILYFALGGLLLKERIWHFARDPYEGGADFGSGPLSHFVLQAPAILGAALLVLACVALPLLIALLVREPEQRRKHLFVILLAVLPTLGIWAVHSYAYWIGGHASGGLLRVLATATPLTVLFVGHTFACYLRRFPTARLKLALPLLALAFSAWAIKDLFARVELPATATIEQQLVERAAKVTAERLGEGAKIYSMHPYFAASAGLDIGDTTRNGRTWELELDRLRPGDLVEWDPHYGPENSRQLLNTLMNDERFALVSMDLESDGPWNTPFGVWLFERSEQNQHWQRDTVVDVRRGIGNEFILWKDERTDDGHEQITFRTERGEYPLEILRLSGCQTGEVLNEWTLATHIGTTDSTAQTRFIWVFSTMQDDVPMVTLEEHVGQGPSEVRFSQGGRLSDREMRIFLWNIDKHPIVIHDLQLRRACLGALPQ